MDKHIIRLYRFFLLSVIRYPLSAKKGFTIVELMVVVIIIGILAALAIPRFEQAVENARVKEAESVLKSIRGAEKIFKAENGNYVGVDINSGSYPQGNCPPPSGNPCASKAEAWDLLNIEVLDNADWDYGVEVLACGCNAGAGWGTVGGNQRCIPYARRLLGPDAGNVMHIRMDTGDIDNLDNVLLCAEVNCSEQ